MCYFNKYKQISDTYCPQGWPERSPDHQTPVFQAVGQWGACPGLETLLWVLGYHLKHHLCKNARIKEKRRMRAKGRRQKRTEDTKTTFIVAKVKPYY